MKKYHLVLLSLLFGVLMVLSWPSRGIPFLALVAWIPLFFIDSHIKSNKQKFKNFSIFFYVLPGFLVWNIFTTYWLYNSTPAGSFMALGLNSLLMSFVFAFSHLAGRRLYSHYQGFLLFVMMWISFEYLHLHWDISWPWLNLGNVFSSAPWAVQWYEYTGAFGGTLYVFLTNIFLFLAIRYYIKFRTFGRPVNVNLIMALVLNAGLLLSSFFVYQNYQDQGESHEMVVVQPNIDPYSEQYTLPPRQVIQNITNLADKKITPQTEVVVAPESAIQENIWEERLMYASSMQLLDRYLSNYEGLSMIIGASTFSRISDTADLPLSAREHSSGFYYNAHNTAVFLDSTDRKQLYHKSKLVAGVEQLPFKKVLDHLPVEDLAFDLGGTIGTLGKSQERKVFYTADSTIKMAPVICYESVYGEFVGDYINNGANVIVIITNDGWWGNTAGHRQHLDFAALRAIETRKSVVRSANTGISAFVDQKGDIHKATNYWEKDVIRGTIKTHEEKTFYTKTGNYIARISVFGMILLLLISLILTIIPRKYHK